VHGQSSNSRKKGDIRCYGKSGVKTEPKSKEAIVREQKCQVEKLRKSMVGNTLLPKLTDRVKASYLIDKIQNDQVIQVEDVSGPTKSSKPIQKSGIENLCIVGSDVASLFPSIKNVEAGRFVRHSVINSKIEFKNFNYLMALRYLTIIGGKDLLQRVGVGRLEPRWLGDRQDLTSLGGTKSRNPSSWADTKKEKLKRNGLLVLC